MKYLYIILLVLILSACDSNVGTPEIPIEDSIIRFHPEVGEVYDYYDEIYVITYNEPYEDHRFSFEIVDLGNRDWELDNTPQPLNTYRLIRNEEPHNRKYWWYISRLNNGTVFGKLKDTSVTDLIKFQLFVPDTLHQGEIEMYGIKTYWNFHYFGVTLAHFDNGNMITKDYQNLWHFSSNGDTDFKKGTLNSEYTFLTLHDSTWTFRDLVRNIIE